MDFLRVPRFVERFTGVWTTAIGDLGFSIKARSVPPFWVVSGLSTR
jgi:hypothetical protein